MDSHYRIFFIKSVSLLALLLVGVGINGQNQFSSNINVPSRNGSNYQKIVSLFDLLSNGQDAYVITSQHVSRVSGIKHVYLQQAVHGIGVVGTESSVHYDSDGKPLYSHNNFLSDIQGLVRSSSPAITPEEAIQSVAVKMGYPNNRLNLIESKGGITQSMVYRAPELSSVDIPLKLSYYYEKSIGVNLVWEFSIMERNSTDWWNFHVDAASGEILNKTNYTLSCFDESHDHYNDLSNKPVVKGGLFYTVEEDPNAMIGSYNVIALPLESPHYGTRSIEADPDDITASPFGWHDIDGSPGPEFTRTQGNNCSAYDDDNNTNSPSDPSDYAEGGAGLQFDFPFNPAYSAADQSEDAAVTNLFYWTNIVHDITYHFGFDEASGNFQENNYGNGGIGSDSVNSEAQDGSGTCNANFGTPPDGSKPRMQMYTCGTRDGDFDNGVIVHEYAHGISNRLTGGAGAVGCLQNQEQMGEGWSDYYALMYTMDANDNGTDARGIGTWLVGQAAGGPGIRTYPYSTDFAINPHTYDDIKTEAIPHGVGSVWCAMLWEMTWDLIDVHGFDSDFYSFTGNPAVDAGNVQALALVTEAMKLQPCSPGFVDGRDAIIQADQNIYGGINKCLIWESFARRGLGFSANQGSSNNRTDGTEAFDLPPGTASFNNTLELLCVTDGIQTGQGGGLPTGGVYSGIGVTDDGNGTTYTFDPSIPGIGQSIVTYTVADACTGQVVDLDEIVEVTSGIPTVLCGSETYTLGAGGTVTIDPLSNQTTIVGGNNGTELEGFSVFLMTPVENARISFDWSYTTEDDPNWDYFGYIKGTNFIALSNPNQASQSGSIIVNVTAGEDFGFAVYSVDNLFGAATAVITNFQPGYVGQFDDSNFTEILQNSDGSVTVNAANVIGLVNSCSGNTSFSGQTTFDCTDVGTNTVIFEITDTNNGLSGQCASTIIIEPSASQVTTFSGGSWNNGVPDANSVAVFEGNYATGTNGNVDACSCIIQTGVTVSVQSDSYLKTIGNIEVNGSLIVEHEGNIVQVNDAAETTNNGIIEVRTVSPELDTRDFMVLGSPLSNESREDVWGSAFMVLYHDTNNFLPNPDVQAAIGPGAENFADDNYDNWIQYPNGGLNPGEGYIVRPQTGFGDPGGIFNYTYDTGTLNNGEIEFPIIYNEVGTPAENKNASPNILANPYASALFADDFLNANNMIDAVYFWEHLTPPSPSIPGAGAMNFDMEDISVYNLSGGLPANNDPGTSTQPNGYIATSQGFGVKASGPGTAVFNNSMRRTFGNTTLRSSEEETRERIWIRVNLAEYELQSTSLIAFSEINTPALDDGYDTRRLGTILSVYSHLEDGSQELGIQAREELSSDKEVLLGFSSLVEETQQYKISIYELEGQQMSEADIYLLDNWNGTIVNLKEQAYEFTSDPGIFNNRFTLLFDVEELLGTGLFQKDAISVFPNPTNSLFNIVSPEVMIQAVQLVDVQGRVIVQKEVNRLTTSLSLEGYGASVYFLRIETSKGTITKQIVKY